LLSGLFYQKKERKEKKRKRKKEKKEKRKRILTTLKQPYSIVRKERESPVVACIAIKIVVAKGASWHRSGHISILVPSHQNNKMITQSLEISYSKSLV